MERVLLQDPDPTRSSQFPYLSLQSLSLRGLSFRPPLPPLRSKLDVVRAWLRYGTYLVSAKRSSDESLAVAGDCLRWCSGGAGSSPVESGTSDQIDKTLYVLISTPACQIGG